MTGRSGSGGIGISAGSPRRPIVLLSAAAFASAATVRVADPLLPQVAAEFDVSAGAASVIVTTFTFAYGLCQVLYGPLGDRVGKYGIVTAMTLLCAATVAAAAFAPSLPVLALVRLLSGATAAAIIPLSIAHIGDIIALEERQVVLARFISGQILGVIGGQVFGGIFGDTLGWRGVFLLLGAAYLAIGLLLWQELRTGNIVQVITPGGSGFKSLAARYAGLLRERRIRVILATAFAEGFLFFGGFAYVGAFLRHDFGLSYVTIGAILGGFGLGGLVYASTVHRILPWLGQRRMVLVGGALAAATFLAIAIAPAAWVVAPAVAIAGLGFYLFHNTLQTAATQMSPEARGLGLSVFASAYFLGQAAGVAVCGWGVDGGGYAPVFIVTGSMMLALAALFRGTLPPAKI